MTRSRLLPAALLVVALTGTACSQSSAPAAAPPSSPSSSTAPAPPTAIAPTPQPELKWTPCEEDFECASLPVPLDADDPSKGTVDLALTRSKAQGGKRIGALLVNPGGPGGSAVSFLQENGEAFFPPRIRAAFDVVAFDPRGVGRSAPVRCASTAELDRYFALDPVPDDPGELSALEAGNQRLISGCQRRSGRILPHVSTVEAADDLERVRLALGEPSLNYVGFSYGTAIGAEYLERYSRHARAMVLDGALDPTLSWDALLEGQSRGFDTAFGNFIEACEQQSCAYRRAVSGPLPQAFDELAARVDRRPLSTGSPRPLGPGEFSIGVARGLYSQQLWPELAQALVAAERGNGGPLLRLNDAYLERTPQGYANISEANFAVNCIDRPWPREREPYLELAERVRQHSPRFGPAIALSGLACSKWPVPPVGQPGPAPDTDATALVIGTTGDPATPYTWSVALAEQLGATLITYEGEGHTVYSAAAPECVQEAVNSYLLTAKLPGPRRC